MSISIYEKTWSLYLQGRETLSNPHAILLLNDNYVFDNNHRDLGDIPSEAIVSEGFLDTISFNGVLNRFEVSDTTCKHVPSEELQNVTSFVLYSSKEYLEDSKLVWYSNDLGGLPFEVDNVDTIVSFPQGIIQIDTTNQFSVPEIVATNTAPLAVFHNQIMEDINNNIMNPDEFAFPIVYTYLNGRTTDTFVNKISTPEEVKISYLEANKTVITVEISNGVLDRYPQSGDKILLESKDYNVAGCNVFTYTTHIYIEETVG